MSNKTTIQEKREALKKLCADLKTDVINGTFPTLNAALVAHYKMQGHEQLKSFKRWKAEGFIVKRGSEALLLWGAKKQEPAEKESNFFPVAFVFSNLQVIEL